MRNHKLSAGFNLSLVSFLSLARGYENMNDHLF